MEPNTGSKRGVERTLENERKQRANVLAENALLQKNIQALEKQLLQKGGRRQRAPVDDARDGGYWVRMLPLMEKNRKGADGFTVECFRRLVEEAKLSLEQASTANAIVLGMHTRALPSKEQLVSSSFIRRCVERAGVIDEEQRSQEFQSWSEVKAWAIAADAGSTSRASKAVSGTEISE